MNQQQRKQAATGTGAATASAAPTSTSPATKQQANSTSTPSIANPVANRTNFQLQSQQQQRQQAQSLQLHNMRPASNQLPNLTIKQPAKPGSNANESPSPATEQSALDMAQSAAARMTGSAVAAIAAQKFKMLRSNTLAAAFGRPANDSEQATAENSAAAGPIDLLAVRTKDERIVNTLSTTSSMLTRNRLNLDAR